MLAQLPYPNMVVEEVEGAGYRILPYSAAKTPPEIGGKITVPLADQGCLSVVGQQFALVPGTAFLYRDCDPAVSYYYPEKSR